MAQDEWKVFGLWKWQNIYAKKAATTTTARKIKKVVRVLILPYIEEENGEACYI